MQLRTAISELYRVQLELAQEVSDLRFALAVGIAPHDLLITRKTREDSDFMDGETDTSRHDEVYDTAVWASRHISDTPQEIQHDHLDIPSVNSAI